MKAVIPFYPFGGLLAVAMAGCLSAPPAADGAAPQVAIAPDTRLVLPRPELGRSVEAVQQVTARRDGSVYVFEVRLQATPDRVQLAGIDPAGRRAMTIDWSGGHLAVERAAWLPDGVRPENVLADLVLAFWPEEVLRQALRDTGASLTADIAGRAVWRNGRELVTVRYGNRADPWSGMTQLRNLAWNYEIEIHSQRVTP